MEDRVLILSQNIKKQLDKYGITDEDIINERGKYTTEHSREIDLEGKTKANISSIFDGLPDNAKISLSSKEYRNCYGDYEGTAYIISVVYQLPETDLYIASRLVRNAKNKIYAQKAREANKKRKEEEQEKERALYERLKQKFEGDSI